MALKSKAGYVALSLLFIEVKLSTNYIDEA